MMWALKHPILAVAFTRLMVRTALTWGIMPNKDPHAYFELIAACPLAYEWDAMHRRCFDADFFAEWRVVAERHGISGRASA
jgi:hypothetical protein